MTMAILSAVLTSTSGLAPVLSATMRFWIKVDSLNRPPTLLTIPSSSKSSSISFPFKQGADDRPHCVLRGPEVVVDYLEIVLGGTDKLGLGGAHAELDLLVGLTGAGPQPPLILRTRRSSHVNRYGIR